MSSPYRLFASTDHDWFVVAKLVDGNVTTLYEGHHREQAYEEMMKDAGMEIPKAAERDMSDGSYEPTAEDFQ